jgi:hypothetical protein
MLAIATNVSANDILAAKIAETLKSGKLPSAEQEYYETFLGGQTPSGEIKYVEADAVLYGGSKQETERLPVRMRLLTSLRELDTPKTLGTSGPFKTKQEEIDYYTKENAKKQELLGLATEEIDNDPDAPQGHTSITLWLRFCYGQDMSLHFGDGFTLSMIRIPSPGIYRIEGGDWVGEVPTDGWDQIYLRNESPFYISIGYITVVHSDYPILDKVYDPFFVLNCRQDVNKQVHLFRDISATKLDTMYSYGGGFLRYRYLSNYSVVYYGAEELGKTDGYKYAGHNGQWCSEFASWLLRKAGLSTPSGNISVGNMEDWFRSHGVLRTNVYGHYLQTGTYLNLWDKRHSAIFLEYVDASPDINCPDTGIRTIEGNAGGQVALGIRMLSDISSFGYTEPIE